MGKTSKWIKNLLTGKKNKEKHVIENQATPILIPPTTRKEKSRWSFRRSSATAPTTHKESESVAHADTSAMVETANEQKKHVMAVAVAMDAAAALSDLSGTTVVVPNALEEAAATRIQSVFRSYLARKALSALRGLVKLQALVRGHLMRKLATATLRRMQALVTVQERARAQRIRMTDDPQNQSPFNSRSPTPQRRYKCTHQDIIEDNIKIVEMDLGESREIAKIRTSYPIHGQTDPRFSTHCSYSKPEPSRIPFDYPGPEYAEPIFECPFSPNYMANTESSKAKLRSHSAPKQRPVDTFDRQLSKRRLSIEGRNMPRAVRMQRSSSHVGSTVQNCQYRWSIKLDRSAVSLQES